MACTAEFEQSLLATGYSRIAGVDEVGRGALAGPVVAAAVILDPRDLPEGINDSKQLSRRQRERLAGEIERRAVSFAVARAEPTEVDQINVLAASLLAMQRAVKLLLPLPCYVLIDGRHKVPNLSCPQTAIVKGDSLSVSIAAASIIAKVTRDRVMREYDVQYPGYGFARHVGYATQLHLDSVSRLGPSAIHRMTFRGVRSYQPRLEFAVDDRRE